MKLFNTIIHFTALTCLLVPLITQAQVSHDSAVFKILQDKDRLIFEEGFNRCNLKQIEAIIPDEFEFHHDKNGITTSGSEFLEKLRINICSSSTPSIKRTLIKGSLEVFPMYDSNTLYGAIQTGQHSFGNTIARFINLWSLQHDQWVPTKIISYDHKPIQQNFVKGSQVSKQLPKEMARYLGNYVFSGGFVLSIIESDGRLYGRSQGQSIEVQPSGLHKFLDENETTELSFVIDDQGLAYELHMNGPNGNQIGLKTDHSPLKSK